MLADIVVVIVFVFISHTTGYKAIGEIIIKQLNNMNDIRRIALFLNSEDKDIQVLQAEILATAIEIIQDNKGTYSLRDALHDACFEWDCLDGNIDFLQP